MTIIKSSRLIVIGDGEDAKLLVFSSPSECEREYLRLKRPMK